MMDSEDYTAPSLIGLDTKEKQLESLQIVRESATDSIKNWLQRTTVSTKIETND